MGSEIFADAKPTHSASNTSLRTQTSLASTLACRASESQRTCGGRGSLPLNSSLLSRVAGATAQPPRPQSSNPQPETGKWPISSWGLGAYESVTQPPKSLLVKDFG